MTAGKHYNPKRRHAAGVAMVWAIVSLVVMVAICSLAVDFGRVQLVKTELQRAADAAARYGVTGLMSGAPDVYGDARDRAVAVAGENKADEQPVTLDRQLDIHFGVWDGTTFTRLTPPDASINAIEVTPQRAAARGNAVPLLFAPVIGKSTCDIRGVRAVAMIRSNGISGLIGLDSVTVKNNMFVASYNSGTTTEPDQHDYQSNGSLASNGDITTVGSGEIAGAAILGPDGTLDSDITGSTVRLPEDIPVPTIDPGSAATTPNPGGVPRDLSVSGTRTLAGGTYYFTSISIANNGRLTFSGEATVYVDGNILFAQNGEITAYQSLPANLKIRQRGDLFGGATANSITLTADILAPTAVLSAKNSITLYGCGFFKSIDAKNNLEFYFDESLGGSVGGLATVSLVR